MVKVSNVSQKPVPHVANWEWGVIIAAAVAAVVGGSWLVAGLAVGLLLAGALYRFGADTIRNYLPLCGLVVAVVAVVLGVGAGSVSAQVSAIEFTGNLAPPINGEVVVESAFNWLVAFASLVLAAMALRWAPRIARSMRRMG